MSEQNFSYSETLQIGQEASALLSSAVFGKAYAAVLEDLQKAFFNTEPGHTRTLEELRREGNALAKVVGKLTAAVTVAQQQLQTQRGE